MPTARPPYGLMGWREKLVIARERKGWSQGDLGSRVGLTQQSVNKWENGPTYPRLDMAIQVAELLGIDMGWWFGAVPDELEPERERAVRRAYFLALEELGADELLKLLITGKRARPGAQSGGAAKIGGTVSRGPRPRRSDEQPKDDGQAGEAKRPPLRRR